MDEESKTEATEEQKGPDAQKAAEKYRAQRDEARAELDKLKADIEALKGSDADVRKQAESLQKQLEEERAKHDADMKAAEYRRVNTTRLAQAGCVDVDVALSLLDENGDVDKLKEAKPYLFRAAGSTGWKPSTPSDAERDREEVNRARKAAGLAPLK